MRRPHVYERSATRAGRGTRPEPSDDYRPAARAAYWASRTSCGRPRRAEPWRWSVSWGRPLPKPRKS